MAADKVSNDLSSVRENLRAWATAYRFSGNTRYSSIRRSPRPNCVCPSSRLSGGLPVVVPFDLTGGIHISISLTRATNIQDDSRPPAEMWDDLAVAWWNVVRPNFSAAFFIGGTVSRITPRQTDTSPGAARPPFGQEVPALLTHKYSSGRLAVDLHPCQKFPSSEK